MPKQTPRDLSAKKGDVGIVVTLEDSDVGYQGLEELQLEYTRSRYAGYSFFRKTENWLTFTVFILSWTAIVIIITTFISSFFGIQPNVVAQIMATDNGAGYLLLAVIAPALWVTASNFMHRRGDATKKLSAASSAMERTDNGT